MALNPITQAPVLFVDLTPDPDLAIRILEAYRENCNGLWVNSTAGFEDTPEGSIMKKMNEDQRQRALILVEAIKLLKQAYRRREFEAALDRE